MIKRVKTLPREDAARKKEIANREWAQSLPDDSLIDWLAAIAHEGRQDWGCLRREILRRIDNAAAKEQP